VVMSPSPSSGASVEENRNRMSFAAPLYDRIGVGYDGTRRADPGIVARLAALLDVPPEAACLDVACGTGNYTTAVAASAGRWHGVEISPGMLAEARAKPSRVLWVLGDALALPFARGCFARVMCTLALHHFADLGGALTEIARVLHGGRLVIFTSAPSQMRQYWLNEYFPDAMARSMAVMPELERVQALLATAGFTSTRVEPWNVPPDLQDLFLYSGKHRPEMYLSSVFRRGISTFAQHADSAEVTAGCARLRADIETGRIDDVRRAYASTAGDYAFIVTQREGEDRRREVGWEASSQTHGQEPLTRAERDPRFVRKERES
jgi:ubiquinone/menaquinone biosynthesis C-methylase UbiE